MQLLLWPHRNADRSWARGRGAGASRVMTAALAKRNKSLLLLFFRKEDSSFLKERSKEL
jgi:hypothetical protein